MVESDSSVAQRLESLRQRMTAHRPTYVSRPPSHAIDAVPLSFPQQRLWFIEQLLPGSAAYHLPSVARLRGALDVAALRQAWDRLIAAEPVLRTRIVPGPGEARQVDMAAEHLPITLPTVSISGPEDLGAALESLAEEPFDLADGPLLRGWLAHVGPDEYVLAVCFHHLLVDGWSIGLFWSRLCAWYRAEVTGAGGPGAPAASYADFVHWQRERLEGEALRRDLAYWEQKMAGAPALLRLPTDRPRPPAPGYRGGAVAVDLPAGLVSGLRELARAEGASLYMTLLALYATLLHRYSGETDIVIGTPVANRVRPGFEDVIGLFANTLPMRTRPGRAVPFRRFLRDARDSALDALSHQDLPFERLVEHLAPARELSHHPVFQVMFGLHNLPGSEPRMPGVTVEFLGNVPAAARYDLDLSLAERNGQVTGRLEYRADLFEPSTVRRMADHLRRLAESAILDPDRPLGQLDMLSPDDRVQVLAAGTGPASAQAPGLVHEAIAAQAKRTPDAIALICLDQRISYAALDRQAGLLARQLAGLGIARDDVVAVCLERSVELVVALLGVLKAGAAYLPVDPGYPAERISYLLRDSAARLVLTSGWLAARLPDTGAVVARVDERGELSGVAPAEAEPPRATAANLAYVIYTSGSTGHPKGVLVEHGNVRNFLHAMDAVIPDTGRRRWLAVTSVSFDISVLELLWTLARGYEVVLRASDAGEQLAISPGREALDVSLFYFGSDADGYRLLTEGARCADRHGLAAVWTPERHFHEFGGDFPNPAVTGAAVAAVTERIGIRAGSVVLPLHDPVRVAEQWAVLDNLSRGRVAVSFASGWQPNDFALDPGAFARRREVMRERLDVVRRLWRGEPVIRRTGTGEAELRTYPRPVQPELPMWLTTGGSRATFELAGELGVNVLTHLLGQEPGQLRDHIAAYRAARAAHGHDPGSGRVTVMLHTYVGDNIGQIRDLLREPFYRYLRTSFGLMSNLAAALGRDADAAAALTEEDTDFLLAQAFDRFFDSSGLIGTKEQCAHRAEELHALGVDELACLIDLGLDHDTVLAGVARLAEVAATVRRRIRRAAEGEIPALLARHDVSHLQVTPSQLSALAAEPGAAAALAAVDVLLVGGEELATELAARLAGLTRARVLNMYGPTETTVWSLVHPVGGESSAVPIGTPVANTQVLIFDENGALVPPGVIGEIYLAGAGVVRGYLNRPGLTAERFVPNPYSGGRVYRTGDRGYWAADGTVRFAGRTDEQVKVRGFRVEPREVESHLRQLPGVREAVVVGRDGQLVGYVVTDPGLAWDADGARARLRASLPAYLVPGLVFRVDSLPRTANGKLDRAALAARAVPEESPSTAVAPPRTPTERVLLTIWRGLLGGDNVGIYDDFFNLGGHSLMAVQAIAAVRDRLGLPVPLRTLFETRTVAELAKVVDAGTFATPAPAAPERLARDAVLPADICPVPGTPAPVPAQVLLTGATGFLGRVLLAELLEHTDAAVHCVVLAADDAAARHDIEDCLRAAGLWRDAWTARIRALAGNLGRPWLGLPARDAAALADEVDAIYHAGALVHLLYPYDMLKGPNVDGTRELLRLAGTGRPKRFHHISTLDVFPDDVPHREDTPLGERCRVRGAYSQSKWVAERLVTAAAERGLATCVLRPGNVAGDTRTGYWNSHDPQYTLIRSCLLLGAAPDVDMAVNLTPVDYVAAAAVRLSLDEASTGHAFHLFNPHPPTSWRAVVAAMRECGYPVELEPYEAWRQRQPPAGSEGTELSTMLSLSAEFDGLAAAANGRSRLRDIEIDCSQTLRALAATDVTCGPADAALIRTYLRRWRDRGLIPGPPGAWKEWTMADTEKVKETPE